MIRIVEKSFAELFVEPLPVAVQSAIAARARGAASIAVALPLFPARPVDLLLICPFALGLYAAVATLGGDVSAATLDDVHDCLCELANVVGGQLVNDRFGDGDMGLPRVVSSDELESLSRTALDRWDGAVMGMDVTLQLIPPAADQPPAAS